MLPLVTGASGAGKSTICTRLAEALAAEPVTCLDFDDVGVPVSADTRWRQRTIEWWAREAVEQQAAGRHVVLVGQVPVGELLAAPAAEELDGIAACLLHCSVEARRRRLAGRGLSPGETADHVAFGEWFLQHTLDPTHHPELITENADRRMRWNRWADWSADDGRWRFEVVDTDDLTPAQTAERTLRWIVETLAGDRPHLQRGWPDRAAPG